MFDLLIALGRIRFLALGLPLAFALAALGVSYLLPVQYKTSVLVTGSRTPPSILRSLSESDQVRDRAIAGLKLKDRYGATSQEDAKEIVRMRVSAQQGRDGLLFITATDREPRFAAQLADKVAEETIRAAHEQLISVSSQEMSGIRLRLDQLASEAGESRTALSKAGIEDWQNALPAPERATLSALSELQAEIALLGLSTSRDHPQNNALLLQEPLLSLQRQLSENRLSSSGRVGPEAFQSIKKLHYVAAVSKRFKEHLAFLENEAAIEIRTVGPAPIPLVKDSPKRLMLVVASGAIGLVLVVLLAYGLNARRQADPRQAERLAALLKAWGLKK